RRLLIQRAGKNAVQPIRQAGKDQEGEGRAILVVMDGNNKKRKKPEPQKGELIWNREDTRGHDWILFSLTRKARDSPARNAPRAARIARIAKESIRGAHRARCVRCVASGKTKWGARG